jgi:hypothetical protein
LWLKHESLLVKPFENRETGGVEKRVHAGRRIHRRGAEKAETPSALCVLCVSAVDKSWLD